MSTDETTSDETVEPYKEKDTLRRLYWDEKLNQREIADRLGCSRGTVLKWMKKLDVKRRGRVEYSSLAQQTDEPWKDEDTLRKLYRGEGLSTLEIAEKYDCNNGLVVYWMEKHGIERRSLSESGRKEKASYFIKRGYPTWLSNNTDGSRDSVTVHQLLACVENDPHDVFAPENHVHHKNAHKIDNRAENLKVMTASEHSALHLRLRRGNESYTE